jgi:hypothetical protein
MQKTKTFSGSLWRESKIALARSYATAAQASMHLGSSVELRTNPKHSFSPHVPFYSTLTVSPSLSSGMNSNTRPMNTEQIPGSTINVLNVVCSLSFDCFKNIFETKELFDGVFFVYLDRVEVNGGEHQNVEVARNKLMNNNTANGQKQTFGVVENQTRPDSLSFTNEVSRVHLKKLFSLFILLANLENTWAHSTYKFSRN